MAQLDDKKYLKSGSKFYCFAGYPSIKIYKESTGSSLGLNIYYLGIIFLSAILKFKIKRIKVRCRNSNGWIKVSRILTKSLEVNFIDIGQGDGCHIVTPDDQHILIDAGEYDNMNRYLFWRFYLYNKKLPLQFSFKVVISHSDKDHYKGFEHVFSNNKIRVSEVYRCIEVRSPFW